MKTKCYKNAMMFIIIYVFSLNVNVAQDSIVPYSKSKDVNIEIVKLQLEDVKYEINKDEILSVVIIIKKICALKGDRGKLVKDLSITAYKEETDLVKYEVPMGEGMGMKVTERWDSITSILRDDVQIGVANNQLSHLLMCVDKENKKNLLVYWDGVTNIKHEGVIEYKSPKYNYSEIGVGIIWPSITGELNYGKYMSPNEQKKINKIIELSNEYKNIITPLQEVAVYEKEGKQYIGTIYDEQKTFRMSFWVSGETGIVEHFTVRSDKDEMHYKLYVQYEPLVIQERIDNKTFRMLRCDNGVVTSFRTME